MESIEPVTLKDEVLEVIDLILAEHLPFQLYEDLYAKIEDGIGYLLKGIKV